MTYQHDIQVAKCNLEYWRSRDDLLRVGTAYHDNVIAAELTVRRLESGRWRWLRAQNYVPRLIECIGSGDPGMAGRE
jgi:hypothetical protein